MEGLFSAGEKNSRIQCCHESDRGEEREGEERKGTERMVKQS